MSEPLTIRKLIETIEAIRAALPTIFCASEDEERIRDALRGENLSFLEVRVSPLVDPGQVVVATVPSHEV